MFGGDSRAGGLDQFFKTPVAEVAKDDPRGVHRILRELPGHLIRLRRRSELGRHAVALAPAHFPAAFLLLGADVRERHRDHDV